MAFPKFLRIAVVPKPSIMYLNKAEDGDYKITGGPEGKLIEICAQALKFSYKLMPSPDGAWGNFENGTWSGAIGMIYRNEADIGISKFGISELRRQYVDYSYPYHLEALTFAIHKPGLKSPIDALTHPFTNNLWLAVAVVIAFMSINFSLFQNINFVKSMLQVIGILTSQSVKTMNESLKDKFIVSAWILGALFLSFSYVAVLLSFLTVPLMEKGVETIEELSAAIAAGDYKATVYRGAMTLSGLLVNKRKVVQVISRHIEKNNYSIEPNRQLITDALRKEKIALISPKDTLIHFVQNEFFVSDDSFNCHPSAIVMSKSFCCKKEVDRFVHILFVSGMYRKHVDDEIFIAGLKSKSFEIFDEFHYKYRSLSIIDMSGAFVLITIGHALAFIVAVSEILYFKHYSKQ